MKKSIITLFFAALFCFSSTAIFAQYKKPNRIFKKGQFDIHASLGLAPTFLADKGKSIVPPMILGADYMVADQFSLGLSVGHSVTQTQEELVSDGIFGSWRNETYEATLRSGVHVTRFDNISIYGGFLLNYNVAYVEGSHPEMEEMAVHKGIKPKSVSLIPGGYVGFKYAISQKITLGSELGFSGISLFRVGVGFRIK
jgi:hypothetical protein